ncbi:hypothetical protein QMZ92_06430 [Streptomyces sp. HNM0645]|uniref:hypothetical protein n=1 Tax=Streptomyces sp. HNM0645 TaxID=2782343 RepID=UPI0024B7AFCB|nr:hypothetical protein [Streptomyces sp. HNM0645]MDI9884039.1 hypothetical protein [Streptomyces sp. HNM0645]
MSQSTPPSEQAASPSGTPFADGTAPAPAPVIGADVPAPAPARGNVGLGLVAALVAALVAGGVYGGVAGAIEREIGWAAIGVGFLVGFAAGKLGGRNAVLPVAGAVLALGAVYLGQLLAIAIIVGKELKVSASEMFFDNFGLMTDAWSASKDFMTFVFFALAAFAAFAGAKKATE